MRKWLVAVCVCLLLAACGQGKMPDSHAEESGSLSVSEKESMSRQAETESASGTPEAAWTPPDTPQGRELAELVETLDAERVVTKEQLHRLRVQGLDFVVENPRLTGESALAFDLVVTSRDKQRRLPIAARFGYDYLDPSYFEGRHVGNFALEWGGVSLLDRDAIAVSTMRDMQFFQLETLEELPLQLDLSSLSGKDYALLGARRDAVTGIVVPFYAEDQEGFLFFDKQGEWEQTQTFSYGQPGERFFYTTVNNLDVRGNPVRYAHDFDILHLDATYLVFSGVFYNADEGRVLGKGYPRFESESENRRAVLYNLAGSFGDFPPVEDAKSQLALYYENEFMHTGFFFDGAEITPLFGMFEEESSLRFDWEPMRAAMQAACSRSDLTIGLDFEKAEADLRYAISPAHLEEEAFAISPDGQYALYRASSMGAGDVMYYNAVLKDNRTGALRYVGHGGGMYGGYGNIGFFSNGEIYVHKLDQLRVLPPDGASYLPQRPFQLPLGTLEGEGITRYLYTFRRDPATMAFTILYSEEPLDGDGAWVQTEKVPYEAGYNYRIGICDRDGNLQESFDTGQPVLGDPFGLMDMSFRLSGDKLLVLVTDAKGGQRTLFSYDPAAASGGE